MRAASLLSSSPASTTAVITKYLDATESSTPPHRSQTQSSPLRIRHRFRFRPSALLNAAFLTASICAEFNLQSIACISFRPRYQQPLSVLIASARAGRPQDGALSHWQVSRPKLAGVTPPSWLIPSFTPSDTPTRSLGSRPVHSHTFFGSAIPRTYRRDNRARRSKSSCQDVSMGKNLQDPSLLPSASRVISSRGSELPTS